MTSDSQTEQSIPEIWFEAADPRRLAVLFRRVALALLLTVAAGAVLMTIVLSDRIQTSERFEDRQLAAAIAAADPLVRDDLAAAAGREAMIVEVPAGLDDDPTVRTVQYDFRVLVAREVPDTATLGWLRAAALRAANDGEEWFTTTNSETQVTWWHTTSRISPEQILVIYRPKSQAMATATAIRWWTAGLGLLVVLGMAGVWVVLRRRVQQSTNVLVEAVEDLRVRGEIRTETRRMVDQLPESPVELKRLARAVTDIEVEIRGAFSEIDSLLRGAEALGSSLDPADVLSTSLEHLENLLGANRSAIVSLDHRRAMSTVLAKHGHDHHYVEALATQGYDLTLPSVRASKERCPVQISDTDSDFVSTELRERAKRFGYRSILAVPLPPVLASPTVLILHKPEPYTYSHYEIELSVSFASIAAAALRNAELFAQTDQSLSEQSSRLSAIVDSVDDGLFVESKDGTVIYANGAITALAVDAAGAIPIVPGETRSAELILAIVHRGVDPKETATALELVRGTGNTWCEVELRAMSGATKTWRVRSFSVTDALDVEIGRGLVWTDVTRDRELDRMKSGLLATVSHEFRTPLALIKGYATTLLANDVQWEASDRYEFLELVASEADRLSTLVQRLLDMRRIDAGLIDLQTVSIELESIVAAAAAGVGPAGDRIEIGPMPAIIVQADEARLVTALRNLLDNACKYSPPGSPVEVTITLEPAPSADVGGARLVGHRTGPNSPDEVVVRIADRGVGVAEEDRASLFEMFIRGDHGLDAATGGTGLGLAIARGFVEAHGGRIWIEDRRGGGSVFAMALPLTIESSSTVEVETPVVAR